MSISLKRSFDSTWHDQAIQSLNSWNESQEAKKQIAEAIHKEAEFLDLNNLNLNTLPPVLGKLNVRILKLQYNKFEYLPLELASCQSLKKVCLTGNQYLRELPMWLRQFDEVEAYLIRLKPRRVAEISNAFKSKDRWKVWKAVADSPVDLSPLDKLTRNEKKIFDNWLKSLELSPEYARSQTTLARTVCSMFTRLCCDKNFFAQIGRRSLHQMYADWKALPESVPPPLAEFPHSELSLENWRSEGKVSEAKKLIMAAMTGKTNCLILHKLKLTSLPPVIGELTHLKILDVSENNLTAIDFDLGKLTLLEELSLNQNKLTSLPPSIGKLVNCKSIKAIRNEFRTLPSSIGGLTGLKSLILFLNDLDDLPSEIGCLSSLEELDLSYTQLVRVPAEIGRLHRLSKLDLSNNRFEFLPPEIGSCGNLEELIICNNPYLNELPLSLGQLSKLTHLNCMSCGPGITQSWVRAVEKQWRSFRSKEASQQLKARVISWKAFGQSEANLAKIDSFTAAEKIDLNEWLVRLEKTRDFSYSQAKLASMVCEMLQSVCENQLFRELFFVQVGANNVHCEDRAAMSLNEIYTSWKSVCLPDTGKLKILTGVAKTLALRAELGKRIPKTERESVEIYLYYESLFKDKLCTAVEHVSYPLIGERHWIDAEDLAKCIEETFFSYLLNLPVFDQMVKVELHNERQEIEARAHRDLASLGECPPGEEESEDVLTWKVKQAEVMQAKNSAWADCCKRWYDEHY